MVVPHDPLVVMGLAPKLERFFHKDLNGTNEPVGFFESIELGLMQVLGRMSPL